MSEKDGKRVRPHSSDSASFFQFVAHPRCSHRLFVQKLRTIGEHFIDRMASASRHPNAHARAVLAGSAPTRIFGCIFAVDECKDFVLEESGLSVQFFPSARQLATLWRAPSAAGLFALAAVFCILRGHWQGL